MKKPLLLAVLTAMSLCVFAQNRTRYVLYQPIEEDYEKLCIYSSCKVKLIKSDKDYLEVSLYGDSTLSRKICRISNGRLSLIHFKKLLNDGEITLYSSKHFSEITVQDNATLIADTLQVNMQEASVDIYKNGQIKADKFIGGEYTYLFMANNATFECPDVSADSVRLNIAKTATGSGVKQFKQLPEADYRARPSLSFWVNKDIDLLKIGNKKYDNPSVSNLRFGLSFPVVYKHPFGNGNVFTAGLEYKLDLRLLFNEVKYEEGDFTFTDNADGRRTQQYILSRSLLLPVKYTINIKDGLYRFSFGLTFGRVLKSNLYSLSINQNNKFDFAKTKIDNLNPWKIEANIGFTERFFIGANLELFANILPMYKSGTKGENIREIGLRLNF